jgi:uncharacterized protein YkwD
VRSRRVEHRSEWQRRAVALALAAALAGCSLGAEATRAHATLAPLAAGHRVCPSEDLSAVVREVNLIRRRSGLYQLGTDTYLARFATSRSAAMARDNRLSHRGWERALRRAGLEDDALGENVAYNYDTPRAVIDGWMRSPGHRANILRPTFKRIGVGCVIDGRGHRWWTQDFAG